MDVNGGRVTKEISSSNQSSSMGTDAPVSLKLVNGAQDAGKSAAGSVREALKNGVKSLGRGTGIALEYLGKFLTGVIALGLTVSLVLPAVAAIAYFTHAGQDDKSKKEASGLALYWVGQTLRVLAFPAVYMDDWGVTLNRFCGGSGESILDVVLGAKRAKLELEMQRLQDALAKPVAEKTKLNENLKQVEAQLDEILEKIKSWREGPASARESGREEVQELANSCPLLEKNKNEIIKQKKASENKEKLLNEQIAAYKKQIAELDSYLKPIFGENNLPFGTQFNR